MKCVLILALLWTVVTSTPFPQKVEEEAELIPADKRTNREGKQFFFIRPFSIPRDFFNPFGGGPDVVDVPAVGSSGSSDGSDWLDTSSGGGFGGGSFRKIFEDVMNLQRDLVSTLVGRGKSPAANPKNDRPVIDIPLVAPGRDDQPEEKRPSIFDSFFGGFPDLTSILGGPSVPDFDKLPDDYSNTTYREQEIDGKVVRVNETTKKISHPGGQSVFHFKVYQVKPDGPEEEEEETPREPGSVQLTPGNGQRTPGRPPKVPSVELTPGSVQVNPPQVPTVELTPGSVQVNPPQVPTVELTPGSVQVNPPKLTPGGAKLTPGGAELTPGGAELTPGGGQMNPGSIQFTPGSVQLTPGSAQVSPGGGTFQLTPAGGIELPQVIVKETGPVPSGSENRPFIINEPQEDFAEDFGPFQGGGKGFDEPNANDALNEV
ncbi:unnamed protein product [Cyprideis torosa]|uniref:Uncharacterized protein n=1 Tax=Cyprideis torosa TaxID=163714 RepID=A0A7R8WIH2_9CRUS|nr:unnamed protein product [Cyprideis torosa]CAG0900682.1 unnamed protein product [Cyprideis torosa]